ncbi:filamentous hemagglutinin N-terminal domain-containing protein [Rhodopseudomonas boonkerdii]|uniref:filamentous haemagglutinin family protein n=1 Tax=Rhodopseudomonas boonkerdii TaxID=475937 RepID=UPI001E56C4E0|nr:filamentous haemagglutinin family protein [Rhodopseudomonas boonkerdii]UGV28505.1 filamentous hemagglutinin N-terminal domain-containing protein [Rhodopseudomonas boonkerdii]
MSAASMISALSSLPIRRVSRGVMLAGASVGAVMLMTGGAAQARSVNGGGGGVLAAPNLASDAVTLAAQQAAAVARQTQGSLARAAKAVQDMQAVQAAARAAAAARQTSLTAPMNVPNGLGAGGLLPNVPAGWSGANAPVQAVDANGQTQVGIRQTSQQAILNWTSFNVGAKTTLTFDQQGNNGWVALNRVNAATGPSQILGNIKADGQVYVINQSGIIFGGNSQINVGSLIASTANIVDPSTVYSASVSSSYVPSFTGAGEGGTGSIAGKIFVEAGAQIATNAPSVATTAGGYVLLLGSAVTNAGAIMTPKGQIALAAGHDFILRTGLGTDVNAFSTTRGSEIAVGTWTGTGAGTWVAGGGVVTNSGIGFAQQGDITLTGHSVVQDGVLLSSTTVNQRGTIHLLNSASDSAGSVTLTGNALSAILPELDSTETAMNSQRDALLANSATQNTARTVSTNVAARLDNLSLLADRVDQSRIEIVTGGSVTFKNGSYTAAQGGQISITAKQRIFTESGATLDVSGVRDVALAMESNNIKVNLQGNELRDAPANRDSSVLKSNDVWIDLRTLTLVPAGAGGYASDRYYTAGGLVEAGGYVANTAHTIGEWVAIGGSITLSAPEVVAQKGSVFNLSGGSLDYAGGWIRSTNLVGSDGRIYSVDQAPSNLTYVSFAGGFSRTHNIQGKQDESLTEIWTTIFDRGRTSLRWEDGYTVGRDAGSLIVSAPTALLEETMINDVVNGQRQTKARAAAATDGYKQGQTQVALAGQLNIGQYNSTGLASGYGSDVKIGDIAGITAGMTASSVMPSARVNTVWLDASTLNSDRLGGLGIATTGNIAVKAPLAFAPGAQVVFSAPNVDIAANITAPSGSITATNILATPTGNIVLVAVDGTSQLTLRSGATISTKGMWSNGATSGADVAALGFLDGGSVTFDSTYNVTLEKGSTIDVSSGGAILLNRKTLGGMGGNVTIIAGDVDTSGKTVSGPANLIIDGSIIGYGVTGGGALKVSTPGTVLIGEDALLTGGVLPAGTAAPVAVKLSKALTIPAGVPLPADLTTSTSVMYFDTPLPYAVTVLSIPNVPTGAVWIPPLSVFPRDTKGNLFFGSVPAGTVLGAILGSIPAGTIVPSAVFPAGFTINPVVSVHKAGTIESTPVTYAAGTQLAAGIVLPVTASIIPAQGLAPSFFNTGFSTYTVNGAQNLLVSPDVAVAPTMPVYQFTASSYAAPSGSDPASVLSLWTPPLFTENQRTSTLTQRGGASITLQSSFNNGNSGGAVLVGDGASINVDPGQSITLNAFRQLSVLGDLTAPGGNITLANVANSGALAAARNFDATGKGLGMSVWIGSGARLDVSGIAANARDLSGHLYGQATGGGSITINGNGSFVMLRPGSELVADGAQTTINVINGNAAASQPVMVASDGGSISLSSYSGLYLDGAMHAFAGGATASGGNLSVALLTPLFTKNGSDAVAPDNVLMPSLLTVTQAYQASALPSNIAPGTNAASLKFGQATISADRIAAGGFGSLSLQSDDFLVFSGSVSLSLNRSLTLNAPDITSGPEQVFRSQGLSQLPFVVPTGSVTLAAPVVTLMARDVANPDNVATGRLSNAGLGGAPTDATFTVTADQIDVRGPLHFSEGRNNIYDPAFGSNTDRLAPGFKTVTLISRGDIRLLPTILDAKTLANNGQTYTTIASDWNINLLAAQIYPTTGTVAEVVAGARLSIPATALASGMLPTLRIGRTTDTIPDAPLSVFGTLILAAPVVEQGGIVRAPMGYITLGSPLNGNAISVTGRQIDLLPGSLTSVSMDGVTIPYGGTIDGVTYNYNGKAIRPLPLLNFNITSASSGVALNAASVNVQSGAVVDTSGGGNLAGAGFISGRGGSVDVLKTALVNANPDTPFSKSTDRVYAIIPGYKSAYAPTAPENGAGDPAVGQQVTIPAGVPGLPAGTYTLLPSNYALLPGAFRVELAGASRAALAAPFSIGNSTYAASVVTGIANTSIRSSLPITALITSGTAVRAYSQYNEQGYSDFLSANTAQFGGLRALLPADGKVLQLSFEAPVSTGAARKPALTFDGTALLQGAAGGGAGQVVMQGVDEIANGGPATGYTGVSVNANAIDAIGAPRLMINGYTTITNGVILFGGGRNLAVRDGVTLTAGEILLIGGNIGIGNKVTLSTIGRGAVSYDSLSSGMPYGANQTAVLALSNGELDFLGGAGNGSITIGAGSQLYAENTLAIATSGVSSFSPSAHFGARNISLAVNTVNIGSAADIALAGNPSGFVFDQALFNQLVNGDPLHGAPALQSIALSASGAINVFGSTRLDATGTGVNLVLNTSALYGYGAASDHAVIAADTITWNGIPGATPPAIVAGGAGTGSGTLDLVANELRFGRFVSQDVSTANRVAYGFGNANVTGRNQIISGGNSKLFVYQAPSAATGAVFGQSGTGGNLNLITPLLTGQQKSIMAYTAGAALNVVAPAGVAPSAATTSIAGAEIALAADSVTIGTTVLLPSGKLAVTAAHDIALKGGSRIDLSGQASQIQSATVYGFGGTASFASTLGSVTQAAGATIDVSATHALAGSLSVDARNGLAVLNGTLKGAADDDGSSAMFGVVSGTMSNAAFAALNGSLNQGGFLAARSFDIRNGDLTIDNGVKAQNVTVALDNGTLTVVGTIDASGDAPGSIRLSASGDLNLASNAVLDVHGNVLQIDSYNNPIEAKNRGHIELTSANGKVSLARNATFDLHTQDGVAYGDVQLNARRTGLTTGDINIDAAQPLNIVGARSIAINGFWTYTLPAGSAITQAALAGYDADNTAFINAAATSGLAGKVTGLSAYGGAYHLRPGVEITSTGDLSTSGDIDLSGYRYGPGADRNTASATYGAGEPLALVIRAGGNLKIGGSISDGFRASAGKAATYTVLDATGITSQFATYTQTYNGTYTFYQKKANADLVVISAWTVPSATGNFYAWWANDWWGNWLTDTNGHAYVAGETIPAGTVLSYSKSGNILAFDPANMPTLGAIVPAIPGSAPTTPMAAMLAPGSISASIRLVAGADLASADQRALQTTQALGGTGNLTLSDAAYNTSLNAKLFSVLRTGTGNLDLLAGGSFSEATPYGVYTAGTQSTPLSANTAYDLLGQTSGGTSHVWYPEHGGDVLLSAQQDVSGYIQIADGNTRTLDSDLTGNWLVKQGGGVMSSDPGAWGINFGRNTITASATVNKLVGFQGIGTLGGGNLTLLAGRNAGAASGGISTSYISTGLDLVVASTGRVQANGTLLQTGGGDLTLRVGGTLNTVSTTSASNYGSDYFGAVSNLRGDITVQAGAIGSISQNGFAGNFTSLDPRAAEANVFKASAKSPGPTFIPGDGNVSIATRGDLVFGGAADAGMGVTLDQNGLPYTPVGASTPLSQGAQVSFALYTANTAIGLYAAGGDVAPLTGGGDFQNRPQNGRGFFPGTLRVAAANGDIRFSAQLGTSFPVLELMPSPIGQIDLLAAGSIYGSGQVVAMSGADMSTLATHLRPVISVTRTINGQTSTVTNATANAAYNLDIRSPIAFGEDNALTDLHAGDSQPARVYAGTDITDLTLGQVKTFLPTDRLVIPTHTTWYIAAKPFEVIAGRDIVGSGSVSDVFLNRGPNDITLLQAGRDIIYQSAIIGGPGLMQVQAGRNLYQGYYGSLTSVGDLVHPANIKGGAGIATVVGTGAAGPDYASFAKRYFDVANLLPGDGTPLAGSGKVVKTYADELYAWLQNRYAYRGNAADALAYFLTLPKLQQGVFVRQVYYAELTLGGREYNDPNSPRKGSYLRGREAIATLFPDRDANGNPLNYAGKLTMFSGVLNNKAYDAGIHTQFGGDIQILNPGGQTVIGVEGVAAGAGAGLVTQGQDSNIDIYSLGSVLLGQSRVMTTFGGDILAWSATGDINAGRGSKTSVTFTPPLRKTDKFGVVTVSPAAPASGAGIATLVTVPGTRPSNIDLIAPLGTIDAGEAGIRVSGNINLAALQVLNAANIQVQGTATGIPTVQAPSIAAALTTTNATAATQQTATPNQGSGNERPSVIIVEVLGYGGSDSEDRRNDRDDRSRNQTQRYDPNDSARVLGNGRFTREQTGDLTEEERAKLRQLSGNSSL